MIKCKIQKWVRKISIYSNAGNPTLLGLVLERTCRYPYLSRPWMIAFSPRSSRVIFWPLEDEICILKENKITCAARTRSISSARLCRLSSRKSSASLEKSLFAEKQQITLQFKELIAFVEILKLPRLLNLSILVFRKCYLPEWWTKGNEARFLCFVNFLCKFQDSLKHNFKNQIKFWHWNRLSVSAMISSRLSGFSLFSGSMSFRQTVGLLFETLIPAPEIYQIKFWYKAQQNRQYTFVKHIEYHIIATIL